MSTYRVAEALIEALERTAGSTFNGPYVCDAVRRAGDEPGRLLLEALRDRGYAVVPA